MKREYANANEQRFSKYNINTETRYLILFGSALLLPIFLYVVN